MNVSDARGWHAQRIGDTPRDKIDSVRVFGPGHVAWLTGILSAAALLCFLCRAERLPTRGLRIFLACTLAIFELLRYPSSGLHFPDRLPLHPCNISTWAAVMACLTLLPAAVEFAYFTGLAGAGMALLTPDMGASWPWQFFLNHGGIIVAGTVLVFGGLAPLRAGAMWRAYGWFLLYMGLVGIFNWTFGTNYAFLCAKPSSMSLLTVMGPWPTYLFAAGGVALAMFWLLWLPVRPNAVSLVAERELCTS